MGINLNVPEGIEQGLIELITGSIRTRSHSDEEGSLAYLVRKHVEGPGCNLAKIDSVGNVMGWVGNGKAIVHFDGHMNMIQINDVDQR